MAYSALPQSAQPMLPTSPQAGASPLRPESVSHSATRRPAKSADATEMSIAATSGLLHFLILLVIISGLTCLYVWQANTIFAIRGETEVMTQEIRSLERQNVSLMLQYAPWDAPGYIEEESSLSGMVVGQVPVRVQLPRSDERQASASPDAEYGFPIRQLAAGLPGSLTVGSQPK